VFVLEAGIEDSVGEMVRFLREEAEAEMPGDGGVFAVEDAGILEDAKKELSPEAGSLQLGEKRPRDCMLRRTQDAMPPPPDST
jgi:hypothetical protein